MLAGCWSAAAKSSPPAPVPAPLPVVAPAPPPDHICVLADKIVEVDAKSVAVFSKDHVLQVRSPITKDEHLPDRCGGPGGGHAGCSITYDRYWSDAIPGHVIEFGTNQGNVLIDESNPDQIAECARD